MSRETLTVTDNRTGESFEVPINNGAIRGGDLVGRYDTAVGPELVIYDPGFSNTASCASSITNIHLQQGVLEHRGYRVEDLAAESSFVEVAYLLIHGELPSGSQLEEWQHELSVRKFVHENIKDFIGGFRHDAQPLAILASAVGALGSFYHDAGESTDSAREFQILRLLAKIPTIGAYAYRHASGKPYSHPTDELSYTGNLLSMIFKMSELQYQVDPVLDRALNVILIVNADHEQNAATTAVRAVGSTHSDPYAAVAAGIYALSGPLRGTADLSALNMLRRIGSVDAVPAYLESVKNGSGRLEGFGHPVYRAPDPRASILRGELANLADAGHRVSPLVAVADALRTQTAEDEYFVERGIHANAGIYSGLLYDAIGIPEELFGVFFAISRSAGFLAQWNEMVHDAEQVSVRPRQLYVGPGHRAYTALAER